MSVYKVKLFKHVFPDGRVEFRSTDMTKDYLTGGVRLSSIKEFGLCVGEVEGEFNQTSPEPSISETLEKAKIFQKQYSEAEIQKLIESTNLEFEEIEKQYKECGGK